MTVYQLLKLSCIIDTGKMSSPQKQGRKDGGNAKIKEKFVSKIFLFKPKRNYGRLPITQPQDTITKKNY
jgi:hypothetical protein